MNEESGQVHGWFKQLDGESPIEVGEQLVLCDASKRHPDMSGLIATVSPKVFKVVMLDAALPPHHQPGLAISEDGEGVMFDPTDGMISTKYNNGPDTPSYQRFLASVGWFCRQRDRYTPPPVEKPKFQPVAISITLDTPMQVRAVRSLCGGRSYVNVETLLTEATFDPDVPTEVGIDVFKKLATAIYAAFGYDDELIEKMKSYKEQN